MTITFMGYMDDGAWFTNQVRADNHADVTKQYDAAFGFWVEIIIY